MPTEIKFGTKTKQEEPYYIRAGQYATIGRTAAGILIVARCLPDDLHSMVKVGDLEFTANPYVPIEGFSLRHEEAGLGYLEVGHVPDIVEMARLGV